MTRDKDRKRIIRTRMKKTGESYTAARAHVLSAIQEERRPARSADLAALAGMSDEKIAASTGRTWQMWLRALDADDAAALPHGKIAALVRDKHGVGNWWAQTVTVGYERMKGLRERGQRRDGTYDANKNRTFDVPVETLFRAFANAATRKRWLDGVKPVVRTATAPKSIRFQWPDGTIVVVGFISKNEKKSVASLAHMKLRDRAAAETAKQFWRERLDALATVLDATPRKR